MLLLKNWEVSVERPVGEVFAAFADRAGHVPFWGDRPDVGEVRKLTETPLGVGTRYRLAADFRSGRRAEGTAEITGFEPDQFIEVSWFGEGGGHWVHQLGGAGVANIVFVPRWGLAGSLEARFTEDDGGTRVTLHSENNLSGWYIPASFILRWVVGRRFTTSLARFKAAVESPTG